MRKFTEIASFLLLLCLAAGAAVPAAAQTALPIRVKCGGSNYTDSTGRVWLADFGYNGGQTSGISATVSGTNDPGLYQLGRWGDSTSKPLTYTFPVSNGSYHVNLYFAETYGGDQKIGGRVFNVKFQGSTIFQKLDIFAAAGANTALIKGADISVTNGMVQIEFDNIADHAKVQAIEITQSSPSPELDLSFTYPDGSPVAGTLNYTVSTSLVKLGGSKPLDKGQATAILYGGPQIMGLVGQFQVNLSLTDTLGHTLWQIAMTMNPTNVNFGSVESSALHVIVQKN